MVSQNASQSNWFDNIKENMNFQKCIEKYDINTCKVIEVVTYFSIGFSLGFLLKRYARAFFLAVIILIVTLFFLDQFKIIVIDWVKIKQITGINPTDTIDMVAKSYLQWIKDNVVIVVSSLIGFLIGYKIG